MSKAAARRYIKLDLASLLASLADRGYTLNHEELYKAVKFAPRFQSSASGYMVPVGNKIIQQITTYPVFNDRFEGIPIGFFTDVAPWDDKRHRWSLYLNSTPGASIVGLGASFYQMLLKEVCDGETR